jgi:hypothetical protein
MCVLGVCNVCVCVCVWVGGRRKVVMCGFCNVWVFGNRCTCIYCVL